MVTIDEEILDPKHPNLANAYGNVAIIYQNMQDYQKALEYQQKAIAILEEILDPKHPLLATSYGNVAVIYQDLGDYLTALEYHKKAITGKIGHIDHPSPFS